jgi:hypothetical protein
MTIVVQTTDGREHRFTGRVSTYVDNGVLQIYNDDDRKTTSFSMANVIKWEREGR